jgi:hypothetical protein
VVIFFLFGLEALFTRVSRAQLCVVCSLPQTVGMLLAIMSIKPVTIGSYRDQTSLLFYSLYCVGPGKILFVNLSSSTFSCTVFLYNVFAFILLPFSSFFLSLFSHFSSPFPLSFLFHLVLVPHITLSLLLLSSSLRWVFQPDCPNLL